MQNYQSWNVFINYFCNILTFLLEGMLKAFIDKVYFVVAEIEKE